MTQLKKKRIGLYARVSTEMQTDGYSIHGQLNQLTDCLLYTSDAADE